MKRAAVFDFDRTLVAGSSIKVFADMLRLVGVDIPLPPIRHIYFGMYRRFGEDPVSMLAARFSARLFEGVEASRVEAAGRLAADVLSSDLLPGADAVLRQHRRSSTRLVLATTAPQELAEPAAATFGFDDVLCSRWQRRGAILSGRTEHYVWGPAKASAVRRWASDSAVDLAQSWAYADSLSDAPLLHLVGRPIAVNPDAGLRTYARARGWPRRRWPAATRAE